MTFYDEVMRELFAAIGAAMFFGNLVALLRRRADSARRAASGRRNRLAKGSSRAHGDHAETRELVQAPVARSLVFLVLGFVMMVAGVAALAAG